MSELTDGSASDTVKKHKWSLPGIACCLIAAPLWRRGFIATLTFMLEEMPAP